MKATRACALGLQLVMSQPMLRMPLAALSNGNADLVAIGLDHHFTFQLGAREHGAAKPDPSIFLAACERLGCAPGEVLHVGDHVEMDVLGAARAGLRTAWVHRDDARERHPAWPRDDITPDIIIPDLAALADLIERMPAIGMRDATLSQECQP